MQKRILIIVVALIVVAGGLVFFLRKDGLLSRKMSLRVYTIGVVRTPPSLDPMWEGFREQMKTLGYEEGKNVAYKVIESGQGYPETREKVALLIDEDLDLIYVLGSHATRAAKEITEERGLALPVIFFTADPIRQGVVKDLKSSGNNLTGLLSNNETISSKRMELFREMIPSMKRAVVAWNDSTTIGIELLRKTAKDIGVTLEEKKVENVQELDAFLASFAFASGDGFMRAPDPINAQRVRQMVQLARSKKVPFVGTNIVDAEQGALMSYGPDFFSLGYQAGKIAQRILAGGEAPSTIPIESPAIVELAVNLKTAEEIGVTISPLFLSRVDVIIR